MLNEKRRARNDGGGRTEAPIFFPVRLRRLIGALQGRSPLFFKSIALIKDWKIVVYIERMGLAYDWSCKTHLYSINFREMKSKREQSFMAITMLIIWFVAPVVRTTLECSQSQFLWPSFISSQILKLAAKFSQLKFIW